MTTRSAGGDPPVPQRSWQPSPREGRLSARRPSFHKASPAGGGWWGAPAAFQTLVALALLAFTFAALALTFPPLSGRIVDQAEIIPPETEAALMAKLAELEAKSGIQLVVATVRSLEGQEIEVYAVDLFRHWQLGEKQNNNGALLLVAPNERRVRIEVGYGLEGTLTDAISSIIIANAITPRFKAGDFGGGIARGVDDIITVLTTDASEWQRKRPAVRLDMPAVEGPLPWIFIAVLIAIVTGCIFSSGFRWLVFNIVLNLLIHSGRGGGGFGRRGGSFGGGGFRGGGGSSGGGGASGRW